MIMYCSSSFDMRQVKTKERRKKQQFSFMRNKKIAFMLDENFCTCLAVPTKLDFPKRNSWSNAYQVSK